MKKVVILLTIIFLNVFTYANGPEKNCNCKPGKNCIIISNDIEPDSIYRILLGEYIYSMLIDNYKSDDLLSKDINLLQARTSFKYVIVRMFYDSIFANSLFKEKVSLEDDINPFDSYMELLYGVEDISVLHELADTFLAKKNIVGLAVLWNRADVNKLYNLKKYEQVSDTGNFFVYSDLAAFYYNVHIKSKCDYYLNKAKMTKGYSKKYRLLIELMHKNKSFSFQDYGLKIYSSNN